MAAQRLATRLAPATVGQLLRDVDTPALIVDLDVMERNMEKMKKIMENFPKVAVRPHAKAHKCAALALKQIDGVGAKGACCQKLCEAEALFAGGVTDLYISNQIVGERKVQQLVKLAKEVQATGGDLSVAVDDADNIAQIRECARKEGVQIPMIVELDVGQSRCGVVSPSDAVELAKLANADSDGGSLFRGVQGYHGSAQHIRSPEERAKTISGVVDKVKATLSLLSESNIPCHVVTGGGTGTFVNEAASGIYTEIQPGSYVFSDVDYSKNLDEHGEFDKTWEHSLFVLTTVMSAQQGRDWVVVDCGSKGISLESGPPVIVSSLLSDAVYQSGGDEHGIVKIPSGPLSSELKQKLYGEKVMMVPGHCDPTVNMYDWMVGIRNGKVEQLFELSGRGPGR